MTTKDEEGEKLLDLILNMLPEGYGAIVLGPEGKPLMGVAGNNEEIQGDIFNLLALLSILSREQLQELVKQHVAEAEVSFDYEGSA